MWVKLDFHYAPSGLLSWARTHATVPTPLHLEGTTYRIFFSTRDAEQRNRVGWVDLDISCEIRVVREATEPVMDLGRPGYFDCDGVYATSLVRDGDDVRLYYAGWNAGQRGYFYSAIGMAVSTDGGQTFSRYADHPILSRDAVDPWACMAPFVLKLPTEWRMWYSSGIELGHDEEGALRSLYDVKSAVSTDGLNWTKTGRSAIALGQKDSNIARACVSLEGGVFRAWYPYVRKSVGQYRIGYGQSADGLTFERMDDCAWANLRPSGVVGAWDGLAVTYPCVFEAHGRRIMLYNGDGFGKTGFGFAEWIERDVDGVTEKCDINSERLAT